jgi:cell division protein FtsX
MVRRRSGEAFDRQQLRQLQQQTAVIAVQAASAAATVEETIADVSGGVGTEFLDKQAQIDALVARLDAAAIP